MIEEEFGRGERSLHPMELFELPPYTSRFMSVRDPIQEEAPKKLVGLFADPTVGRR